MEQTNNYDGRKNKYLTDMRYYIEKVKNPDTCHYIVTRALEQMQYYSKNARLMKRYYNRLTATSIISMGLVPMLAILSDGTILMKALIAAAAVIATGSNAFMNLINPGDLWSIYRKRKNTIERYLYFYFNNSDVFSGIDQEEADKKLIELVEKQNGEGRHF